MYLSSFLPLQTALSGVEAAQQELETTSNNITNANTPGYTAETVDLAENPPVSIALSGVGMQVGTGVTATGVTNASDPYLDAAYRNQNAATSNATTEQSYLDQVQSALDEPTSTGISAQLSTFWSAWNDLAANPTSVAAKQAVVNDGTTLSDTINALSQQLSGSDPSSILSQATAQLTSLTGSGGELENDANQIAQLNQAIQQAVAGGQNPNSLIDQRNKAIDDLSTLGKTVVLPQSDGTITVNFGDAATSLVQGKTVNWPQTITTATGGKLGALLNLTKAGGQIAQYSAQLDAFASQLASAVNNPVVNGTAVAMNPPFFTGTTASTLKVAVSAGQVQTTDTLNPGDNDIAAAVAALAGGGPDQTYSQFVSQIGSDTQVATMQAATQQALLTGSANRRQSVEGVDLSVQMTNLIQQQQAYQASAKVMNAFSTMMDALMQNVA